MPRRAERVSDAGASWQAFACEKKLAGQRLRPVLAEQE